MLPAPCTAPHSKCDQLFWEMALLRDLSTTQPSSKGIQTPQSLLITAEVVLALSCVRIKYCQSEG